MDRFWSKVEERGDCLVWTACLNYNGYGRFKVNGKLLLTHRYVFTLLGIDIPKTMEVMHSCDNPPCVNPGHLMFGSHDDNMKDMMDKGRQVGLIGENHPNSKLTKKEVIEIRKKYSDRRTPTLAIAKMYGVSQVMISYILIGNSWKTA